MKIYELRCTVCGRTWQEDEPYKCPVCGGVVRVSGKLSGRERMNAKGERGIFRFRDFFPEPPGLVKYRSLNEGNTPLLCLESLGKELGIERLYAKNEGVNPTGSFKDRALAYAVNRAAALGRTDIVVASTGNASASACAYGASLGLKSLAIVPESTPNAKVGQALTYGAKVIRVPGSCSYSFALAGRIAKEYGFYNVTTTYINPFTVEGYKSAAYEIFLQMEELPDWVLVPIGAGPFLAGIGMGFEEMKSIGMIEKVPKLAGIQAAGCSPIARAFASKSRVREWTEAVSTMASGIDDALIGYQEEGGYTLEWIERTGGAAAALTEEELLQSVCLLAQKEGIYAEPSGASGVLGAEILLKQGYIRPGESVLLMVTGHGLKNPVAGYLETEIPVIENDRQLKKWMEQNV